MDIDTATLSSLSNDELFKTMKKCGLNVGPITPSTRSVYEKKLKNYIEGNQTISDTPAPKEKEPVAVLSATIVSDTSSSNKPTSRSETRPERSETRPERSETKPEPPKPRAETPLIRIEPEPVSRRSEVFTQQTKSTILTGLYDDVSRNSVNRSVEPIAKTLQSETSSYASSSYSTARIQPAILQTTTSKPTNDLEFKLIKPATSSYVVASATTTNFVGRRDTTKDYGLLDDKQSQPVTLSSGYKLPESYTPNIRNRVSTTPRIESQPMKPMPSTVTPLVPNKTSQVVADKPQGTSFFKYLAVVVVLFFIVYFLVLHLQSNPENPVEFLN